MLFQDLSDACDFNVSLSLLLVSNVYFLITAGPSRALCETVQLEKRSRRLYIF